MIAAAHPSCDAALARAQGAGVAPSRPGLVLATTILASSLGFVDGSMVSVALPAIGEALDAGAASRQWIVNASILPLSALLLAGGAAGDRWGRRGMLILGTAIFGAASLACALAPSLGWFLAGRLLQGVGAALLMPSSLAILGQSFEGPDKGRAVGLWAAAGALAGALGPLVGGWLVDAGWWRGIFLVNLPIAAAAVLLARRHVPASRGDDPPPLDGAGAALATAGLAALVWGLTDGAGPAGWTPRALALAGSGVALLAMLVAVEDRKGDRAMIPLAVFGSRNLVGLTLLTFLLYAAFSGFTVLLPYVLIKALGYSATAAGAALLPLPLVLAGVSPAMGGLAGRVGTRWPLAIGALTVGAGLVLMTRLTADSGYWPVLFPAIVVVALGMSGAVAPLTAAVLASVDARHAGLASGLNSAVARTGGLLATALLGAALAAEDEALITAFRVVAWVAATGCAAAAACIVVLYRETPPGTPVIDVPHPARR